MNSIDECYKIIL